MPTSTESSDQYSVLARLNSLIAAGVDARRWNGLRRDTDQFPDPLTNVELRIPARRAEHRTYANVAIELHLSLNTVKTHLRHSPYEARNHVPVWSGPVGDGPRLLVVHLLFTLSGDGAGPWGDDSDLGLPYAERRQEKFGF
jgi:hypothetical protein